MPADQVVQTVYRAAALLDARQHAAGVRNIFAGSARDAAAFVRAARASRLLPADGQPAPAGAPIVPLAGLAPELIQTFHVPREEVGRLLEHASSYIQFHDEHESWNVHAASTRVRALAQMASLLNKWAERYREPALRRAPSQVEHHTAPSLFDSREVVGVSMRALLTINPGNLVGYEPDESATWEKFSKGLGGFVRAHLLNKHLGGSGRAENISYMSSNDNTRMSGLAEEQLKREVLENGKSIVYGVDIPMGAPSQASVDPKVTQTAAASVRLRASEVAAVGDDDVALRPIALGTGAAAHDLARDGEQLTFPTQPMADRVRMQATDQLAVARLGNMMPSAALAAVSPAAKAIIAGASAKVRALAGIDPAMRAATSQQAKHALQQRQADIEDQFAAILNEARTQLAAGGASAADQTQADVELRRVHTARQRTAAAALHGDTRATEREDFIARHKIPAIRAKYVRDFEPGELAHCKQLLELGATIEQATDGNNLSDKAGKHPGFTKFLEELKGKGKGKARTLDSFFGAAAKK